MKSFRPYRPFLLRLGGAGGAVTPGWYLVTEDGDFLITEAGYRLITDVAVVAVTLVSIAITPDAATINDAATQQFTATGTYSDSSTANITGSVTWDSSNDAVATITSGGLATGVNAGAATISATLGAVSDSTALTVQAVLVSIAITPDAATINDGATQQFTATGTYSDSSTADITATVTWDSSNDAIATITAGGLATGAGPGQVTISATLGAVSDTTTLNISAVPLFQDDFTDLAVDAAGTFGRLSTAYHKQPDGVYALALSGESRWSGARRAENRVLYSQDFTNAAWVTNAGATKAAGQLDPLGGNTAVHVTFSAANGAFYQTLFTLASGSITTMRFWAKTISGTAVVVAWDNNVGEGQITIPLTAEWRLYSLTTTHLAARSGQFYFNVRSANYTGVVAFAFCGFSYGSLPDEYLVTTSAFRAAYYPYANGNTVASNVVTEAQGAALPGPFGLLMEPAATNYSKYSSILTTWAPTDSTVSGNRMTATAQAGVQTPFCHPTEDTVLPTTGVYCFWADLKKVNMSLAYFAVANFSTTLFSTFNFDTQEIVISSGTAISTSMTLQVDGSYRCAIVIDMTGADISGKLRIGVSEVNGTVGVTDPDGTEAIDILWAQVEAGSVPTSRILTTTAAVARAVDTLAYTGIAADNETRQVINAANVDIDDWSGTKATPTVPQVISSIKVYAPGERPA